MNKQMPKNVRKTVGIMMLTGVMALGAFSLLRTGVVMQQSNIIATTDTDGNGDNTDGARIGLKLENEANPIKKYEAIPELETEALKGKPYSFTLTRTGTLDQVVRLNLTQKSKANITESALDESKIHILVNKVETIGPDGMPTGSSEEIFKGTLNQITTGDAGFGKCLKLVNNNPNNFAVYAWIDEGATVEDLFGAAGTDKKSIEFKMAAKGIQYDGVFTADDEDTLKTTFEANVNK